MIPQLAGLYKKYNEQGFEIVGLECQGSAADAIKSMMKDKGAGYQCTTGGSLTGANVSGIPHGFLFGADGKMVSDSLHGNALESKIKELLKEAGAAMAGPGPYVKLAPQAAQIKAGVGLGQVLTLLRKKKDSKDSAEAAEANMMYDALNGAAQGRFDGAMEIKAAKPLEALVKLDKLAAQFAGDEIGTKAKTEADAMKKDPKVKTEVEADTMWKQIAKFEDQLKPVRGEKDYKDEAFRKANAQTITTIVQGCTALNTKFPGTAAAAAAESLMNQFK